MGFSKIINRNFFKNLQNYLRELTNSSFDRKFYGTFFDKVNIRGDYGAIGHFIKVIDKKFNGKEYIFENPVAFCEISADFQYEN